MIHFPPTENRIYVTQINTAARLLPLRMCHPATSAYRLNMTLMRFGSCLAPAEMNLLVGRSECVRSSRGSPALICLGGRASMRELTRLPVVVETADRSSCVQRVLYLKRATARTIGNLHPSLRHRDERR